MKYIFFIIALSFLIQQCTYELPCEKHLINYGFVGKVTIVFNQKNGENVFDNDGCIVHTISSQGKCLTACPFRQGTAIPRKTVRYFEYSVKDSLIEIFEFDIVQYLHNGKKEKGKCIYYGSSGYSYPNYVYEYYVDYYENYFKYFDTTKEYKPWN